MALVVDDEMLHDAVINFAPAYVFHPDERYFPLTFPKYVRGCSLQKKDNVTKTTTTLKDQATLTLADLTDVKVDPLLDVKLGPNTQIYLKIEDPDMVYGMPINTPDSTPKAVHYVYTTIVQVDSDHTYIDMLFNLLYGFNCMAGDDHTFDSEYVIVRVKVTPTIVDAASQSPGKAAINMTFVAMWTSRHGGGGWYTADKIKMVDKTHPVSYVALGSHANYIGPGVQRRLWGFGNDVCASSPDPCGAPTLFQPKYTLVPKPTDASFPGDATVDYMAYTGKTCEKDGFLMAWKPRFLNTIQTPPQKASDDTAQFVKQQIPGVGNYTFYGVLLTLTLVMGLQMYIFSRNTKSIGHATWQQLLVIVLCFTAGVISTYSHMLL